MKYPTLAEIEGYHKSTRGGRAIDRLHASYAKQANGCWRWMRAITTVGYGHFHFRGAYYQAHRIMYEAYVGPVPAGMNLDHLCRNRWCVNPAHLEPVAPAENTRRGAGTKLNADSVRLIFSMRSLGLSQRQIARALKVDHSTVCRVLKGERWGHLTTEQEVAA